MVIMHQEVSAVDPKTPSRTPSVLMTQAAVAALPIIVKGNNKMERTRVIYWEVTFEIGVDLFQAEEASEDTRR